MIPKSEGVKSLRLPARLHKEECLERMMLIGEGSLKTAAGQFCEHYHPDRNRQGLENKATEPEFGPAEGEADGRERHGGLLRCHYRDAA